MKYQKMSGFSLLEVLIALSLSSILILTLVLLCIGTERNYNYQIGLARIQTHIRLTAALLTHDIQNAGYIGCPSTLDVMTTTHFNLSMLRGYNSKTQNIPISEPNRLLGTDAIVVMHAADQIAYLPRAMDSQWTLILPKDARIHVGEYILISDCQNSDAIQVNNVKEEQEFKIVSSVQPLSKLYNQYSTVAPLKLIAYFIGHSNTLNSSGKPINALFRRDLNTKVGRPDEIVTGVNNLRIQYLVKSSMNYVPADLVSHWENVVAVELKLLFDSVEDNIRGHRIYRPFNLYVLVKK